MWIDIIVQLLKLVGLLKWADQLIVAREQKQQAQDIANVPTNKQETADYFRDK